MNKWVIFLMTNVHSAHSVVETSPALLTGPESRPMPSGPLDFSRHHFLKSWFCFVSVCGSLAVLGSVIRLTCFSSCNHCCYKNLLCLTLSWSCVMASSFCASGDFPALRSFLLLHFSIVSKNETHSKCFPVFSSHSSDLFALLHLPFFMFIFRINSCRLHCPLSLHFWSLLCVWNSWHLWPNCIFNTPDISLKLMKTVAYCDRQTNQQFDHQLLPNVLEQDTELHISPASTICVCECITERRVVKLSRWRRLT